MFTGKTWFDFAELEDNDGAYTKEQLIFAFDAGIMCHEVEIENANYRRKKKTAKIKEYNGD